MPGLGAVRGAFFRRRCAAPAWGGWLKDPAKSGGGVFDLLIHDVDMCLHLFGRPEAVSAIGYCDTAPAWICCTVQLFYPFGTVVVSGRWQHEGDLPVRHGIQRHRWTEAPSSSARRAGRPRCYNQTEQALPLEARDGYAAEIEYFVECCRSGRQPERCPPRESANVG